MKITSVKITKVKIENSRLRGMASILIDGCFAVNDIRIIEGDRGLFVAMPTKRTSEDTYKDIAYPINSECRRLIEDAIFNEYNKLDK